MARRPKILIGALSGWKYHERRHRCIDTWMSDADAAGIESVFLLGCPTATAPEGLGRHYLALPCPDDYPSLPQRTLWFTRWALARDDWDYLFKCDDDTYISIPRLLAYDTARPGPRVLGAPPGAPDYIGAEWKPGVAYASGGAGYWLSRKAAAIIAEKLTAATGAEDLLVGQVLRGAGIPLAIEPRLVPFGSMAHRPRRDNDLITLHAAGADAFLATHAETGWVAGG